MGTGGVLFEAYGALLDEEEGSLEVALSEHHLVLLVHQLLLQQR
jgi:hypothetical protein